MYSLWKVTFKGPNTRTFIKKLGRFLDVQIEEILLERYIWDGEEKVEQLLFRINHSSTSWIEFSMQVIKLASRITPEWKVLILDPDKHIYATIDRKEREEKGGYLIVGPSGFKTITWEIKADQKYDEVRLLGKGKNQW